MYSSEERMHCDVTVLSDPYFTPEQIAAYERVFDADPNLWFVRAMTTDGKELLIFNGSHPDYSPAFVAQVNAAAAQGIDPATFAAELVKRQPGRGDEKRPAQP